RVKKAAAGRTARKTSSARAKSRTRPAAKKRSRKPAGRTRTRRRAELVPTPPSSLNMNRRGTAARTGRAEIAESLEEHRGMTGVTGGDVDVDAENAYFSGDEAPGGDNPTPD